MNTLTIIIITSLASGALGYFIRHRYDLQAITLSVREEMRDLVHALIDRAEALQDTAEEEIAERAADVADLARRIKRGADGIVSSPKERNDE